MKISRQELACLTVLLLWPLSQLCGQVGNNNPTGVSGIFNGNITTGCSYDPYTGNATRTITDIAVAGAVGQYALAFSRTYNSRNAANSNFGLSGWHHNYDWDMDDSATSQSAGFHPTSYTINYPDGRTVTFAESGTDPYFRGPLGIRERLQPLDLATMLVYLILPDGGKVEFAADQYDSGPDGNEIYWYHYVPQAIIDPYGQRTVFTHDGSSRLSKVIEPAGRYIQLFYTTSTGPIVDHVTASDGRAVQYYYINSAFAPGTTVYTVLDHIVYYNNSSWTARYRYRVPNVGSANGVPLLWTCDDPMYPGPMKRIAYFYKNVNNPDGSLPVYGQINSENYYDGTNIGAAVSTLSVIGANTRNEIRGVSGPTRGFTYSGGYIVWCTDFNGINAYQTYDANKYIASVTDRNGKVTNYTHNAYTGVITQIKYPLTQSDTPGQSVRPTVNYSYTGANCSTDATNPYYVCTVTDEGGHVTSFTRDGSKRVTSITYPDGGTTENFGYNSFGQVTSHKRRTNGYDYYTYDTRGLKTDYRSPDNPTPGNPTARFQYEGHDWLFGVTDVLGSSNGDTNHTTSFSYNLRGQVTVTTRAKDPVDNNRHTIQNVYNADGTLQYTLDELSHRTDYSYDDYKRTKTIMTPLRFTNDPTSRTTYFYYDNSGTGNDYTDTDSQPTWVTLPGGQRTKNIYDNNFRKLSTTVAYGTGDAATTSCTYDNVGNQISVLAPNQQLGQVNYGTSTVTVYDARNRVQSITDALGKTTSFQYDLAGRKYRITRANGQTITYDSYDEMNRLLQQTVTQTPNPDAVTKYTYTVSGLLYTMQDPRLVAQNSTESYLYTYDQMARKTGLRYPPDSNGVRRWELFDYDNVGRLYTFTNRKGDVQTFTYDALHRMTGFSWDDGLTPSVTFGYDVASRLIAADTVVNATIDFAYFNDNLLQSETEHITNSGWWGGTVSYTYDANGNRASDWYPDGRDDRTYTYTNRNQLKTISEYGSWLVATYAYDKNGNVLTREPSGGVTSTYTYDELDRVTGITHAFNGTTRTFDYDYDAVGNRKWTKRDGGNGDAFAYDFADQVTAVKLEIANPDTAGAGSPSIVYDANGNRTSFAPYGTTDTYAPNNLNQYSTRNGNTASYDITGNMTTAFDGSLYTYDAQNRLISATKSGTTVTFKYDALNRLVTRTFSDGRRYDNIWDGWNLILTYDGTNNWILAPTHSPNGIEDEFNTTTHTTAIIYRDASGNTTHIADAGTGLLLEWYRYDLDGTPIIYDANNNPRTASAYDIRHLFTGQQWYSELGLYDLRNRFYSPDIGRFLQPDPIGFDGDRTNLYRYCTNNPVTRSDPSGEQGYTGGPWIPQNPHDPVPPEYTPYGSMSGPWQQYSPSDYPYFYRDDPTGEKTYYEALRQEQEQMVEYFLHIVIELLIHLAAPEAPPVGPFVGDVELNPDILNMAFYMGSGSTGSAKVGNVGNAPLPMSLLPYGMGGAGMSGYWGTGQFPASAFMPCPTPFAGAYATHIGGASTWTPGYSGPTDMISFGLWFGGNTAGQGIVGAMEPGLGEAFQGGRVGLKFR